MWAEGGQPVTPAASCKLQIRVDTVKGGDGRTCPGPPADSLSHSLTALFVVLAAGVAIHHRKVASSAGGTAAASALP
jgi:hypothetical protein